MASTLNKWTRASGICASLCYFSIFFKKIFQVTDMFKWLSRLRGFRGTTFFGAGTAFCAEPFLLALVNQSLMVPEADPCLTLEAATDPGFISRLSASSAQDGLPSLGEGKSFYSYHIVATALRRMGSFPFRFSLQFQVVFLNIFGFTGLFGTLLLITILILLA